MKPIRNHRNQLLRRTLAAVALCLLSVMGLPTGAMAATQGFNVLNGQPQQGMLMSLTANPQVVEEANTSNAASLVGVVAPNESSFDIQPGQTSVATDGTAKALVSTLHGSIRVGDRIAASSLQGIGAKATSNGWIVGIAQGSLNAQTTGVLQSTVTDSSGATRSVYVASIPILVKVTYYTTASDTAVTEKTWVPSFLQRVVDTLAGKHVSPTALVFSFVLFIIGILAAAMVVSAAIRSGFLAISRQPLAKRTVLHEEWRSFGLALAILGFVMVAIILLLRVL